MRKGDNSDTDFQAQGAESDENDTEGYDSAFNSREEIANDIQQNGSVPEAALVAKKRSSPTLSQPTVKGNIAPSFTTKPCEPVPRPNAYLTPARPFKRVKVPSGPAPHFNGDGPADYIPLGGLPPTHLCSACDEIHPMGWCRLKVAGIEHCGLCGLAHVGHGRTCPHLNSEVQVATLLGTLKESTESRELIEQATKYLRMIRGDLVQRKRKQESQVPGQTQMETQVRTQVPSAPGYAKMNGGPPVGNFDVREESARLLQSYLPRPPPL